MLFKYKVSSTPDADQYGHQFLDDVCKILNGQTSGFSANMDAPASGVVGNSTPLPLGREWTIERSEAGSGGHGTHVLSRAHSKHPSITTYIDLYAGRYNSVSYTLSLNPLGGIEADGTRIDAVANAGAHMTHSSASYRVRYAQDGLGWCQAGTTIYIGVTDSAVFICNDVGARALVWSELWPTDENHYLYSYDNAPAGMVWGAAVRSGSNNAAYKAFATVGLEADGGEVNYSPSSAFAEQNTYRKPASQMPCFFNDGTTGIALMRPTFHKDRTPVPALQWGNIHFSRYSNGLTAYMGRTFSDNELGTILLLTDSSAVGGDGNACVRNYFVAGV